MITIPKGTKDCLPSESYKWQFVERTAREVAAAFHVKEIRTPTFEHTEVFLRGIGDTTDVVNKEMYTFLDKGDRSITLKPEGTAGVARAFVEDGFLSEPMPVKLFYLSPCFRYERPQAGRLREFHQFGVEMFGADTPETDAEVILLAKTYLEKVGVKDLKLFINSIGCKECRKAYNAALKKYLYEHLGEMCETCRERYETNPLRILDCKEEACRAICEKAPKITDYLCDDCRTHFERLKAVLKNVGVEFTVNPNIVRGLDYYTKTVFEFVSSSIGAQGTVCGGGRYDGLVEQFGGAKTSGVGFGLGLERLLLVLESQGKTFEDTTKPTVYFVGLGDTANDWVFSCVNELRKNGIQAEFDHVGRSVKSQFKYADKIGAKYVAVLGDDELSKKEISVKNMADGTSETVPFENVVSFFSEK